MLVIIIIETERLKIRKFTEDDWMDLYEYLSLESTYRFEPGRPITREEAHEAVKRRAEGDNFLAVELNSERKMIGHVYLGQIEPEEFRTWEIGYIFNPKYQNRGFATEAARAVIEFLFKNRGVHRVVGHCNPENIASARVLSKVGMTLEGRFRKNIWFRKNAEQQPIWCDTLEYAMLETDLCIID